MANHGQLTILTSAQRADFALGKGHVNCELVKISWPSPDGVKWYAFDNWLADSTYATPLGTLLGSDPLIVAFGANGEKKFHSITRTSAIGDDVVSMQFSNYNRDIETLIRTHGSGVKVEFYWFFPLVDGGCAVNWFLGYLRTPSGHGAINKDFVTLTAASGFRSANMQLPNLSHPQQCPVRFGGQMTYEELLTGHPCDYNRHLTGGQQTALGGARGTLNAGSVWTTCPHTTDGCLTRMGDELSYMGVETVVESVPVGLGQHKTTSTTIGRESSLKDPASVVFGNRKVACRLISFRRETNPSPDHLDAGTLVTLFEACLGPIQSITNVELMERTPQGLVTTLGEQQQAALTSFSPSVSNFNRRVVFNANHNPINPASVQVAQMSATAEIEGCNDVRVYSDSTTFVEQYTTNRAWCLLKLLTSTWFGFRLDVARLVINDFIYLASKNSTFNCEVQARSAQSQIEDICRAANWFTPFNHDGITRFLPMQELDTTQSDIPTFTDTGASQNIIFDDQGLSTLTVAYKDDDEIPNSITLLFEDADHDWIERPLLFDDWNAQAQAGSVYGDNTKRLIEKSYAAYGITNLTEAVPLGATLRDIGEFGNGGLLNNLEVTFVTRPSRFADAMDLHENKAIKVVSDKLTGYNDPNGDQFQYFIVKRLERTDEGDLIVTAQAYGKAYYDGACSPSEGYVTWPTPNSNVIDGPHGTATKVQAVTSTNVIVTGETWPGSISPTDVVIDRWIWTVDQLPTSGVFNVTHPASPLGFKLFANGQVWIYHSGGIDSTSLPAGSVSAGDTLSVEFDKNGGSPVRRYKHNGVTKYTDTTSVTADNEIAAEVDGTLLDVIGDIYWQVYPCTPSDQQEPGETGGGTTTGTGAGYGLEQYGYNYGN